MYNASSLTFVAKTAENKLNLLVKEEEYQKDNYLPTDD